MRGGRPVGPALLLSAAFCSASSVGLAAREICVADRDVALHNALEVNRAEIDKMSISRGVELPRLFGGDCPDSFALLYLAERHPARAQALMAPLICWSFSSSMFKYLLVDHVLPATCRSLAAARLRVD